MNQPKTVATQAATVPPMFRTLAPLGEPAVSVEDAIGGLVDVKKTVRMLSGDEVFVLEALAGSVVEVLIGNVVEALTPDSVEDGSIMVRGPEEFVAGTESVGVGVGEAGSGVEAGGAVGAGGALDAGGAFPFNLRSPTGSPAFLQIVA
jgi:hypothetical protein